MCRFDRGGVVQWPGLDRRGATRSGGDARCSDEAPAVRRRWRPDAAARVKEGSPLIRLLHRVAVAVRGCHAREPLIPINWVRERAMIWSLAVRLALFLKMARRVWIDDYENIIEWKLL